MPTYKQTVRFEREFAIEARDAAAANEKLDELVRQAEWDADVREDGHYEFEDEPVECPKCKGNCVVGDDEQTCDRCNGDGCVPFTANSRFNQPSEDK